MKRLKIIVMLTLISTLTYGQKSLSYGHVEKYRRDSAGHYLQITLVDNILKLKKVVTLEDSNGNLVAKIMTHESYKITDLEENEIKLKLHESCQASGLNLNKINKERFLLDDNIEEQVKLDSKSSLIILDGQAYFIEKKIGFDSENMSESEKNEFDKKENIIKHISMPIQDMYYKKSRRYKDLFY